jgi:hypothetical protein
MVLCDDDSTIKTYDYALNLDLKTKILLRY